ncbi:MAG: SUMF1/EgtB/PvdO family nonheme iron enzyme [Desulfococcaceae bacterium]
MIAFLKKLFSKSVSAGERGVVSRDVDSSTLVTGDYNIVITAEKVTRELWETLAPPRLSDSALQESTRKYLEFFLRRYRYLDFKGMGVSDRVPLRLSLTDMYVPLRARIEMPEGDCWARDLLLAGRKMCSEETEQTGQRMSEPVPVLDLLQKNEGLIVLGDPGAGKTTFIKYLTLMLAMGQGQPLGLGTRLPVLVPLSAYANALEENDIPLNRFIDEYYCNRSIQLPLCSMMEEALKQGGALLLLDGLDEVQSLPRRMLVVERVTDFFSFHREKGNKFVLTSRIVGYREVRPVAEGLAECTLTDFDREEIALFIDKWTLALERAAQEGESLAKAEAEREKSELLASVDRNPGVRQLAANPLLLTILALMKRQGISLPERRVQLYQKYVETLLRHWNLARGLDHRYRRDLDDVETVRILAPLALWMHEISPGLGLVKKEEVRRKLEQIYTDRGAEDAEKNANLFMADVRNHTALLLERGPGTYGFIHLTFQEYLAAVAVAQKGQMNNEPVVRMLAEHADDPAWAEVTRLSVAYTGIVLQQDEKASAIVSDFLRQAPGKAGQAPVLAGKVLLDAWPGGLTAACRKEVIHALLHTLEGREAEPVMRAEAGRILARTGDPRPEVLTLEAMQFCRVPVGNFLMGDGEERHENTCLHYDFWMGRFPVTNAQYNIFVQYGGYREEKYWTEAVKEGFWKQGKFKGRWENEFRDRPYEFRTPFTYPNHPVVGITWYEAMAFVRWLTEKWKEMLPEKWAVRLPSEAEWEKAARGGLQIPEKPLSVSMKDFRTFISQNADSDLQKNPNPERIYPWGSEEDIHCANVKESGIESTSAVGAFAFGKSPYGCEDMSGNVWERTRSLDGEYPYDPGDGREDPEKVTGDRAIMFRGGSYCIKFKDKYACCGFRVRHHPHGRNVPSGFRVLLSPFPLGSDPSEL